jgi:hypothetical protein
MLRQQCSANITISWRNNSTSAQHDYSCGTLLCWCTQAAATAATAGGVDAAAFLRGLCPTAVHKRTKVKSTNGQINLLPTALLQVASQAAAAAAHLSASQKSRCAPSPLSVSTVRLHCKNQLLFPAGVCFNPKTKEVLLCCLFYCSCFCYT